MDEVLQNWVHGARRQSVPALATEHALGHEMHVPVLAEASTALQTQSADVCSMDPPPDTRVPQASRHSHLAGVVLGRAHIRHCQRFPDDRLPSPPPLLQASALIK